MLSRRGLITGAAALAAYSQMEDAEAVNRLLLLGGVPHLPGSAVDMNFAAGQYYGGSLSSLISVSRASQKTNLLSTSASGYPYLTFANNTAAITPGFGILIEQASSNIFLNSSAPVTQSISLAATGSYTLWVNGSGSAAISAGSATITGAGTATNGSPVTINCTATGTVTVTISGSLNVVQLEQLSFPTSYIPTTSSTVARAADVVTCTGLLQSLLQGASGSALIGSNGLNYVSAGHNSLIDSGNNNSFHILGVEGNAQQLSSYDGTNVVVASIGQGLSVANNIKSGAAWSGTTISIVSAAGSVGTGNYTRAHNADTWAIGSNNGNGFADGYITRVVAWPYRLSDASIQSLTHP